MTDRAKLRITGVLWAVAATGCVAMDTTPGPMPIYDRQTRRLVRLDWDADRDGRIEQRTYFVGAAPVRTEVDTDRDGRVDRWEYVGADAAITHVGTSRGHDGVEDTWTWQTDDEGVTRVEYALYGDRLITRREFIRHDALIRAEEDANRDGLVDKWETWEHGVLAEAAFDTTFAAARPDRRVVYDAGHFAYLETDSDGDGHFERLVTHQPGSGDSTRDRH